MGMKMKKVFNALTTVNSLEEGGLSSLVIPRILSGPGAALVVGGTMAYNMGKEGLSQRNKAMFGKVSYADGPARMTNSFTSGVVDAMHKASDGNPAVFADMASSVVKGPGMTGAIETYGATPELISALYNMGGR